MIPLPRDLVLSTKYSNSIRFDLSPIQLGLGRDPWKVIVASQLLVRVKRNVDIIRGVLTTWPTPATLAASDSVLEAVLRPLGLWRRRAAQLQRMSLLYAEGAFQDVRDLPGVGPYVSDAVGLFCYGCTDLESSDGVLEQYAFSYMGPSLRWTPDDMWTTSANVLWRDPVKALCTYEMELQACS